MSDNEKLHKIYSALLGDLDGKPGALSRLESLERSTRSTEDTMTAFIKRVDKRDDEQNIRIGAIETTVSNAKAKIAGVVTGVSIGGTAFGAWVSKFFGGPNN